MFTITDLRQEVIKPLQRVRIARATLKLFGSFTSERSSAEIARARESPARASWVMPSVAGPIRVSADFIDHRALNEFGGFDAITVGQLIHFVMSKMAASLRNMLGITRPDITLFRTFRLRHLLQMFRERTLTIVTPGLWDDPFENFITGCVINYSKDGIWHQDPFDRVRKPVYGQCWSLAAESDAPVAYLLDCYQRSRYGAKHIYQ